jgi:hypothetical protein
MSQARGLWRDRMTPIHRIHVEGEFNRIYLKREDLMPFSFGGNKCELPEKSDAQCRHDRMKNRRKP